MDTPEHSNTLFLDRDGVINCLRPHDYVKSWEEFVFLPGVLEAFRMLDVQFTRIVVVTNQRGVGRGWMSVADLHDIHRRMTDEILRHGGRIDRIYCCTDLEEESPNRKPNIGMALQAQREFPEIDFSRSVVVGDSDSDMEFGRRIGAQTVLIQDGHSEAGYKSLYEFAILNQLK